MAKQVLREVHTWSEYLEVAQREPPANARVSRDSRHDSWAGCTWAQALEMATGAGYQAALPEAEALSTRVADTVAADLFQTTFVSTWEVSGAEVDMGRFLSGEPECMIESAPIRISRQGRAVRLLVPTGAQSDVPEDTIRRRGAAVMALVEILARAQHPLEIWAVFGSHTPDKRQRTSRSVLVQEANQPLDSGRVMFALAHPGMLRRIGFATFEQSPDSVRQAFKITDRGGYGYGPRDARLEDVPEADGTTIILPELRAEDRWDEAYAVAWIEEQVGKIFAE